MSERRMLSLAPVLVNPRRLLVIDEPTLGLAPMLVNLVMSLIQELRDSGTLNHFTMPIFTGRASASR
jgi:branched-chain amino acid transport system ATP-binding protein